MTSSAEFMREYETSGRAGGVGATLRLIDDNAIYWFSDGTSHVGKAAIERAIRRNAELIIDDDYHLSGIKWLIDSAELAVCVYRFNWSGTVNGEPMTGSGRGTSVLARRGESWVVLHEHLSKGPVG